jgi:hypothetical protein
MQSDHETLIKLIAEGCIKALAPQHHTYALLAMWLDSQSSPSYKPSPEVAQVLSRTIAWSSFSFNIRCSSSLASTWCTPSTPAHPHSQTSVVTYSFISFATTTLPPGPPPNIFSSRSLNFSPMRICPSGQVRSNSSHVWLGPGKAQAASLERD